MIINVCSVTEMLKIGIIYLALAALLRMFIIMLLMHFFPWPLPVAWGTCPGAVYKSATDQPAMYLGGRNDYYLKIVNQP